MSRDEADAFLREGRTIVCATIGHRGWPHVMPLWYTVRDAIPDRVRDATADRDPEIWAWTFAKSQKVRNIERDAKATLQLEAGDEYDELRGIMLECDVVLHRDPAVLRELGVEVTSRYATGGTLGEEAREVVLRQAPKRVGLQFVERRRATWDHRKLRAVG